MSTLWYRGKQVMWQRLPLRPKHNIVHVDLVVSWETRNEGKASSEAERRILDTLTCRL